MRGWGGSDQRRVNMALLLLEMRVELTQDSTGVDIYDPVTDWRILKGRENFQVAILPQEVACRLSTCQEERKDLYYIWHKGGRATSDGKKDGAEGGHAWFLRYNWESVARGTSGLHWLRSISL